jgi:hypothetical protein
MICFLIVSASSQKIQKTVDLCDCLFCLNIFGPGAYLKEPCGKSAKIMFDLGKSAHFEFGLLSAWLAI